MERQRRKGRRRGLMLVGLVGLLVGAAACGGRGVEAGGQPLPRTAVPGIEARQRCAFVSEPAGLPPFSRMARVGTRGNLSLWGVGLGAGDTATVSIRYGEDGRMDWVRTIDSSLPEDRRTELEDLLRRSLNERGPEDWGVRLFIAGGTLTRVAPSVVCPPMPRRDAPRHPVPAPTGLRGIAAFDAVQGRRFDVEISTAQDGQILGVRLIRSSGIDLIDQFLIDWIMATRFHPKAHDGFGLASTFTETLIMPRRR